MKLLSEIIVNAQINELFEGVPRLIEVTALPNKATIIIGVRRCGKSTLINQIISHKKKQGLSNQNILHLNFFDDRLANLRTEGLNNVMEAFYSLYPEKKNDEKIICFFDEIQVIPLWELFIERLLRTEKCEIYITGSSARMLSKEVATQMRGRALSWELFPFSFEEYLTYKNLRIEKPFSTKSRLTIQKIYTDYWNCGGFPEVFGITDSLRIKIHQEYFNSILFRDLIERYDVSHPRAVIDLARILINAVGSLYTLNRLTNHLKSLGHKVAKMNVAEYIEWFEDAYFLFTVRVYDASYSKSNANPKKIYCIDHALVTSVSSGILVNSGHLLENLVFVALRRVTVDIYYYKTKGNREVDFLVLNQNREKSLIQVTDSLANTETRKRELLALQNSMEELGLESATIVTQAESEQLKFDWGFVNVVPIWKFLLDVKMFQ